MEPKSWLNEIAAVQTVAGTSIHAALEAHRVAEEEAAMKAIYERVSKTGDLTIMERIRSNQDKIETQRRHAAFASSKLKSFIDAVGGTAKITTEQIDTLYNQFRLLAERADAMAEERDISDEDMRYVRESLGLSPDKD